MGVALTSPSTGLPSYGGGAVFANEPERHSIPDNAAHIIIHFTAASSCTVKLNNRDITTSTDSLFQVAGVSGTYDSTVGCNGTDRHAAGITGVTGPYGNVTIYHTTTGVPYCRSTFVVGAAKHPKSDAGSGFRVWPRGHYYNKAGVWTVLH